MRRLCDWVKFRTQPGSPVHDKWPETANGAITERHFLNEVMPWSVSSTAPFSFTPTRPGWVEALQRLQAMERLEAMADKTRAGDMHVDEHLVEVTLELYAWINQSFRCSELLFPETAAVLCARHTR